MYHSGHVTHAGFFSSSKASVFVVATESHVVMIDAPHCSPGRREVVMVLHFQVAGIDSDSGALLWRHAQETDQLGEVKALKVKL